MDLLNKLRIGAVVLGTCLLFSGIHSTAHPKFKVVARPEAAKPSPREFLTVDLKISASSRIFGVSRILAGSGSIAWVLWTFRAARARPLNRSNLNPLRSV